MSALKKAWKSFREGTSKSLEPLNTSQVTAPVAPQTSTEIVAPVWAPPIPPEETPEMKLYNQLASMDSDTVISKVLGVPRLPGEAMVLSKLLSDDKFVKWLKIHVLKA